MTTVALMGAGGKMGYRITERMKDHPDFTMRYVEVSQAGIGRLSELGVKVTPQEEAIAGADAVILALPDIIIGKVSAGLIPRLAKGTLIIGLDPAAAYAGVMPIRDDLAYFVSHPCHPAIFSEEADPVTLRDWFGGVAKQDIVNALYRGPEEMYATGEKIARVMYAPVRNSYRITVEQMAILEPALVETFTLTLIDAMKQGLEEVVKMGVPEEAARAFLFGHIRVELAITFGVAGFNVSDGAKLAMEQARDLIFRPDWKQNIFSLPRVKESVERITGDIRK